MYMSENSTSSFELAWKAEDVFGLSKRRRNLPFRLDHHFVDEPPTIFKCGYFSRWLNSSMVESWNSIFPQLFDQRYKL